MNSKTIKYENIEMVSDRKYLYEHLSNRSLKLIDDILGAYFQGKIDFEAPRFENGEPDFTGEYQLIINDTSYQENGYELIVMKWVEDHETTGYMVDCFDMS